ncbi:MAG: hypothetical protein NC394_08245 [Bacteroides sp.]|nr:hypothetical protein [Bacteroides sp.]
MSKTCQNCGNIFEDSTNVCPRCGMQYIEAQSSEPTNNGYYQTYQQPYGQQQYSQPYQQPYQQGYGMPVQGGDQMTLGSWVGTILLTNLFGIISIILLFVWGFSDTTPPAKKNYCRAMLIYQAIMIGIVILMLLIILPMGFAFSDMY